MCICSCVTLSTTLLMRAVQFNARSACDAPTFTSCIYIHDVNIDASQADRALNWTARITKNIPSISGLPMLEKTKAFFCFGGKSLCIHKDN